MCGIAGIVRNHPFDGSAQICAMTELMRHRGPDGAGFVALEPGRGRVEAADLEPRSASPPCGSGTAG